MRKLHKLYRAVSESIDDTKWSFYGEVKCDSPNFNTMEITEKDNEVTCKRCLKIMKELRVT
ncbi:hypothetical protein LCGC14_0752290 [marine sediment metagenome]|uniref:Uncharacterized protein n=1 Tax=marine sediment metagenome TaxID=412755 RepID=A0A0F9Q7S7_9ZZZZ